MEQLYGVLLLALSISLGLFAWRDVISTPLPRGLKERFRLFSTMALSCNILLFSGLYMVDLAFNGKHPPSQATVGEYKALIAVLWVSRIGIALSFATIVCAALSARGLARRLCIWGSSVGVAFWVFAYIAESEFLQLYSVSHAGMPSP